MAAKAICKRLILAAACAVAASGSARAGSVALDMGALLHTNTQVNEGNLVIAEVNALDPSGTWYRHPWGYDVWEIQLTKDAISGFTSSECCLLLASNLWASQTLYAFNGHLMRSGPKTSNPCVATLANGYVMSVPDFAARPSCLRFVTFGSHAGSGNYIVTLNYSSGGPSLIAVPIASAATYPRDASGSGWQTEAITNFTSACVGRYGDLVTVFNPWPSSDLVSVTIQGDASLSGPIAVSLCISQADYEMGYLYYGNASSGDNEATALRAPEGSVGWKGIKWSATIDDPHSEIAVDVYCGDAEEGGAIGWRYAGAFDLTAGTDSATFDEPCAGEYIKCSIDMIAELAESPELHDLEFTYDVPSGVGEGPRAPSARLYPAVPNPFNPSTTIRFAVPSAGTARLDIHDAAGRLVRTLVDADLPPGEHAAVWDGKSAAGRAVQSGIYFARLRAGGGSSSSILVLVR